MRAWIVLMCFACVAAFFIGRAAEASYLQNVVLQDVKANGTALNYFGRQRKFWNFRGYGNSGGPSVSGDTMTVPVPVWDPDGGILYTNGINFGTANLAAPSPSPGAPCGRDTELVTVAGAPEKTYMCCHLHLNPDGGVWRNGLCGQ